MPVPVYRLPAFCILLKRSGILSFIILYFSLEFSSLNFYERGSIYGLRGKAPIVSLGGNNILYECFMKVDLDEVME